jgi:hypothetical protein
MKQQALAAGRANATAPVLEPACNEAPLLGPTLTAPCEWSLWPTQRFSPWPPLYVGAPCLERNEREHDGNARDVDNGEGDETWGH